MDARVRGEPVRLGLALQKLLEDPWFAERMEQKERRRVLEQFTWDRIAEKTLWLYRSLTGRPLGSQPQSRALETSVRRSASFPIWLRGRRWCGEAVGIRSELTVQGFATLAETGTEVLVFVLATVPSTACMTSMRCRWTTRGTPVSIVCRPTCAMGPSGAPAA
jgi:hypothetical protein